MLTSSVCSSFIGATSANSTLAATAQIIIAKPLGTFESTGINLNAQLRAIAVKMQSRVGRLFFAGGTIIAINIPYIAIQRAETSIPGRIFPATAPRRVPRLQPR